MVLLFLHQDKFSFYFAELLLQEELRVSENSEFLFQSLVFNPQVLHFFFEGQQAIILLELALCVPP